MRLPAYGNAFVMSVRKRCGSKTKMLPGMKLITILMFASCLHASGQSAAQNITLKVQNESLRNVLNEIKKQSGYVVFYDEALLKKSTPVDVDIKNISVSSALAIVFKNQVLTYEIIGKIITIKEKPAIRKEKEAQVSTPSFIVTGKVTDEDSKPLQNVSILLSSARRGASTDLNGNFSILVPNGGDVLEFSYVGLENYEIKLDRTVTLNVTLKRKENNVEEVVVVGYGTQRKKDVTGSIASVKVADLQKAPVASFADALGGRVAGVNVTGQDGQPGSDINIVIRGNNSLTQDNSPLYVIDGFPIEGFSNNLINQAEIESIEVLKDASATAIYGARGANGVILITTKKGKEGPPVISYEYYYGIQQIRKKIQLLSPYEFVRLQLDLSTGASNTYLVNPGKSLDDYKKIKGIDMQDRIFRDAPMQSHYINLNGGSTKTKYSLSGNYFNQDGIIRNSNFKRYQFRATLDQNVNDNLKVGSNFTYTNSNTSGTISANNAQTTASGRSAGAVNSSGYLMYNIWSYRPVNPNGLDLSDQLLDPGASVDYPLAYPVNPYLQVTNELRENIQNNFILNAFAEQRIFKKLKLRISGGINRTRTTVNVFNNSNTSLGNPITSPGIGVNGSTVNADNNSWVNENTLTYTDVFNKNHKVDVLLGVTSQGAKTSSYGLRAVNLPNESLGLSGLDQGVASTITAVTSEWTLASFLGRVNYGYKSKYLFTANFRADGSSRFAPENKWAYFPSGSIAWRISQEDFMKALSFITDAKLRVGYGQIGNNRVNDFAYLSVISVSPTSGSYSFNNATPSVGSAPTIVGNKELKWETTTSGNIGLDLTMFNHNVLFTADVYRKVTSDLLLNAQVPFITGYSSIFKNIGKVQNQGLELSLSVNAIKRKNFSWNSNINISFNRNKLLALTENQESLLSLPQLGNNFNNLAITIAKLNSPVGLFYGLIWDGVYQNSDFNQMPNGTYQLKDEIALSREGRSSTLPGNVKYRDINGDLLVNDNDYTVIGNPNPLHTGGFSNNFSYKNFDLSLFMQWSYGNDVINVNRIIFEGGGAFPNGINQYATVANRWSQTNQSSNMPRFYANSNNANLYYSSRVVEDGSYLRLKTVSLGYSLPVYLLKKLKIKSLRIYSSAQNLITWTKYSGYDPEVATNYSALTPGIDYSAYPRARTITLGLNLSF